MKAITIPEPGDASALVLADVPDPQPAPGEVRVRVAAAGVNRADVMQRMGFYPPPPGASGVPRPRGQRHRGRRGRRRRRLGASATRCARCCPGVATPSWSACPPSSSCRCPTGVVARRRGGPARGREHGVVQRVHDREPPSGTDVPGARRVVRHRHDGDPAGPRGGRARRGHRRVGRQARGRVASWAPRSSSTTASRTSSRRCARPPAGAGADVILDNMGAKYLARNVDALAPNGRLVVIGLQGGAKAELDLGPAAAQAGGRHRDLAAGPAGRREGDHRRGRARARLAARRGGSGHAGHPRPLPARRRPPTRTASSRPAATSARSC